MLLLCAALTLAGATSASKGPRQLPLADRDVEYAATSSGSEDSSPDGLPDRTQRSVRTAKRVATFCGKLRVACERACCCLCCVSVTSYVCVGLGVGAYHSITNQPDDWHVCPYIKMCPAVTIKGQTFYDLREPKATLKVLRGTEVPFAPTGQFGAPEINCSSPMMWGIYKNYSNIYQRCCGPNASVPAPPAHPGKDVLTNSVTKLSVHDDGSLDANQGTEIAMEEQSYNGQWVRVSSHYGARWLSTADAANETLPAMDLGDEAEVGEMERVAAPAATEDGPATRRLFGGSRRRMVYVEYCDGTSYNDYIMKGAAYDGSGETHPSYYISEGATPSD